MAHLLISAAHKSSGKTTVAVGLCAALVARGRTVQPFKKGPDYIDPMWLGRAAGRPCRNLDFYTMSEQEILGAFCRHDAEADFSVIEGNKGLYDGLDVAGSDSNAALAALLGTAIVLVIDSRGMTRGIAPLIRGYQAFDPEARIVGLILNKVGGSRHEGKLRRVLERYTELPVLGAIQRHPELEIGERHLGLVPANEAVGAEQKIARIAEAVAAQVDLERLCALAAASTLDLAFAAPEPRPRAAPDVRIGVARDAAFGFYYPDDLEALAAAGAVLVPVDTLGDSRLPTLDGLFLGGGFPETQMAALEANAGLRADIRQAAEAGLPIYAECGGLLYLGRRLSWRGQRCDMVGALPTEAVIEERPVGRGYVRLEETGRGPWPRHQAAGPAGAIPAHEFHHSRLVELGEGVEFAYRVLRGTGVDGRHDGIVYRNVLASFAHLRHLRSSPWADRFVNFVRTCKGAARDVSRGRTWL